MDSLTYSRLSLFWFVIFAFLIAGCNTAKKPISHQVVCSERTVFVGDLGKDENEPRLRLLLEQSLRDVGFTVIPDRQQADIALSGILTVQGRRGGMFGMRRLTLAYATIKVETLRGVVWTIDFPHRRSRRGDDPIAIKASEVANSVLKACRQGWSKGN